MAGAPANIARGMVMGAADVIPGVSGGTMALILGIYERFIAAIAAVDASLLKAAVAVRSRAGWQAFRQKAEASGLWFLLQVGLGLGIALLVGAHLIGGLIEGFPVVMMAVFFGLILASARIPWRRIQTRHARQWAAAAVGFLVAAATVLLPATEKIPGEWFLVIAGALAITAMLLPGISGSALLVLLGVYPLVLSAVREVDLLVLGLFAAGAVLGLVAASRGIRWLLRIAHDTTMAALAGLMLGSLVRVWPWRTETGFGNGLPAAPDMVWPVVFLVAGAILSLGLELLGSRNGRPAPA